MIAKVQKLLGYFFRWIGFAKSNHNNSSIDVQEYIPETIVEENPPSVEPIEKPKFDLPYDQTCFLHTRKRIKERYDGIEIDRTIWDLWVAQIKNKSNHALYLQERRDDAQLWRVWFGKRVIFVVYKDGIILTALRNEGKFNNLVRKAMRKREVEVAKNKPKRPETNIRKNLPKLPPPHLRPKRNEALLAALKNPKKDEYLD